MGSCRKPSGKGESWAATQFRDMTNHVSSIVRDLGPGGPTLSEPLVLAPNTYGARSGMGTPLATCFCASLHVPAKHDRNRLRFYHRPARHGNALCDRCLCNFHHQWMTSCSMTLSGVAHRVNVSEPGTRIVGILFITSPSRDTCMHSRQADNASHQCGNDGPDSDMLPSGRPS